MERTLFYLFSTIGVLILLKYSAPFLVVLVSKLFRRKLAQTVDALGQGGEYGQCSFNDFSPHAQSALDSLRQEVEEAGGRHLVDYKNVALDSAGSESVTSVWTINDGGAVVCLTYIALAFPHRLLSRLNWCCSTSFSGSEVSVTLESTSESGKRLMTVSMHTALPTLPKHFTVKSLDPSESIARLVEVHNKRFQEWQKEVGPILHYRDSEIFFLEQRKQRAELNNA